MIYFGSASTPPEVRMPAHAAMIPTYATLLSNDAAKNAAPNGNTPKAEALAANIIISDGIISLSRGTRSGVLICVVLISFIIYPLFVYLYLSLIHI